MEFVGVSERASGTSWWFGKPLRRVAADITLIKHLQPERNRWARRKELGYVYLYTGTGAGKTANALGLALRSVGHKRKVVIIQFLKWWKNTGEYKIRDTLSPYYEIYQFGRKGWIGLGALNEKDREFAQKGIRFAAKIVEEKKPQLLILDEVNLAVHCGLLSAKEVEDFLDKVPERTDVVMTGRYAPKELISRADFVNEVVDIKYPKQTVTTKGIQY